jgi:membrane protein DedA with SNARE-associated domain
MVSPWIFLLAIDPWTLVRQLGGPGLVILAIFDHSFVPIPGSLDALTIILATGNPEWWWYYALMAIVGSVAGGYLTYRVGRKGGKEALEKRFPQDKMEQVYAKFEKGGFLAIFVPALLPPPFPMTPFLVAAGALALPRKKFLLALLCGRTIRYGGFALLAFFYGRWMITTLAKYKQPAFWSLVVLAVLGAVIGTTIFVVHRRRRKTNSLLRAEPNKAA